MSLVHIGICPVCKNRVKTSKDGKVYSHKASYEPCAGKGSFTRVVSEYEQFVSA